MKKLILCLIIMIFVVSVTAYTPDTYDDIQSVLTGDYTADVYTIIQSDLSDLSTPLNISNPSFNASSINADETIRLNTTIIAEGQTIDKVWTEMQYPNGTLINYSMSLLSGIGNYTLVFNETSQTGQYNISKIFANTTDGTLNYTDFSSNYWLNFTVSGGVTDLSFSITLPLTTEVNSSEEITSTTDLEFNVTITTGTQAYVNPIVKGTSNIQNSTVPIFQFTNYGNVAIDWVLNLNATTPSCMKLLVSNNSGTTNATALSINYTISSIPIDNTFNIWLFANFTNCIASDSTTRKITHIPEEEG